MLGQNNKPIKILFPMLFFFSNMIKYRHSQAQVKYSTSYCDVPLVSSFYNFSPKYTSDDVLCFLEQQ